MGTGDVTDQESFVAVAVGAIGAGATGCSSGGGWSWALMVMHHFVVLLEWRFVSLFTQFESSSNFLCMFKKTPIDWNLMRIYSSSSESYSQVSGSLDLKYSRPLRCEMPSSLMTLSAIRSYRNSFNRSDSAPT